MSGINYMVYTKFSKSEDELDKLMRKLIGDIVK